MLGAAYLRSSLTDILKSSAWRAKTLCRPCVDPMLTLCRPCVDPVETSCRPSGAKFFNFSADLLNLSAKFFPLCSVELLNFPVPELAAAHFPDRRRSRFPLESGAQNPLALQTRISGGLMDNTSSLGARNCWLDVRSGVFEIISYKHFEIQRVSSERRPCVDPV